MCWKVVHYEILSYEVTLKNVHYRSDYELTNNVGEPWNDFYVYLGEKNPYVRWWTHWGQDKMAAIFLTTYSNAFFLMKMYEFRLNCHWSLFLGVQLTVFQYWFR